MSDFKSWPIRSLSVTSLRLDPQNPRITADLQNPSQADLIRELVMHDEVYDLASKIADQGFYPTDALIVVKEGGHTFVVEGNRRLAALKLLLNPKLAPPDLQNKFSRLAGVVAGGRVTAVRVAIAPSREAAVPLLMSRHTGTEIVKWESVMQARLYESLMRRGMTIPELAKACGGTENDVMRYLRTHKLYRMAKTLDLSQDVADIVANPRSFKVTNLTRLTESQRVRDFLGLEYDEAEVFRVNIAADEFRKGFRKMVHDVAKDTVTSRTHNTKKEIDDYLGSFGSDRPDKHKKGSNSLDELIANAAPAATEPVEPKVKRTAKSKPRSILPLGCHCGLNVGRINDVFRELKSLKVADYRNACAMVFRSLVDMATQHYFDKTGHTAKCKAALDPKGKSPRSADYQPSLDVMLKYILATPEIPLNPTGRKALHKLVSAQHSHLTLDSMNGFVHNRYTTPTEEELRSLAEMLQPLLELVLVEPEDEQNEASK